MNEAAFAPATKLPFSARPCLFLLLATHTDTSTAYSNHPQTRKVLKQPSSSFDRPPKTTTMPSIFMMGGEPPAPPSPPEAPSPPEMLEMPGIPNPPRMPTMPQMPAMPGMPGFDESDEESEPGSEASGGEEPPSEPEAEARGEESE